MPDWTTQGDPELARVTELVRVADRLGLRWGLRPGTVVSVSLPYDPREASVQMDGDLTSITVVSLINDLALGDRVMVLWVPSAGQYAIGLLNAPSLGAPFTQFATTDTATITAETVTFTFPSVTLVKGTAYRVDGGTRIIAGGAVSAIMRLRKTNIAGTIVAESPSFFGHGGGLVANSNWRSFITPNVTMTSPFVYTVTGTAPGVVGSGSAVSPRFASITPVGRASEYPQSVVVS
jgi:hypothetical protein